MYGIDVAKWQAANIVSLVLAKQQISFVIVQISYGLEQKNPLATQQIADAKSHNLLLGGYHWLTLDDPVAQAKYAFNQMKVQGLHTIGIPMVDYEQSGVSPTLLDSYLKEYIALSGVRPIVYVSASLAPSLASVLRSNNCGLWVAHYNGSEVQEYGSVIRQFTDTFAGMELDGDISSLTSAQWASYANPGKVASPANTAPNPTQNTTIANSQLEDDDLMKFTYEIIDAKTNKSQGTIYWYNGTQVVALSQIDQLNIVRTIYKDTTGKDMKHYQWKTNAPWYTRFLQANNQKNVPAAWK